MADTDISDLPTPSDISDLPIPTVAPAHTDYGSPTEGMSGFDKFMAGAGKAQIDAWRGIRQLFGAKGAQEDIDEAAQRDRPLMQTGAGQAGYAGGAIADAVIPAGIAGTAARAAGLAGTAGAFGALANPSTYVAGAASGALQGAIQPVATGDSRLWNTVSGAGSGVIGQGLAKGASAIVSAAADPLAQAGNKAAQALIDAGVPLDAAQRTGSILLQRAKAMLGDNPLTAGAQRDFQDMQSKALTRGFLQTIGETANDASPKVMGQASMRMGQTYDNLFDKLNLPYDKIEAPLSDLMNQARIPLDDQQFAKLNRVGDDILNKASTNGGIINGKQWQNVKQTLDEISGNNGPESTYARQMRGILTDGLAQHATDTGNEADAQLLRQTNQQWRNMKTIEASQPVPQPDGTYRIAPNRVAGVMGQQANRSVSTYGRGDTTLSDLADAGTALLGEKTNQSGTIPRALAQLGVAGAIGGGEALYSGDWKRGLEYGAAAYAIPKALQMGVNAQGPIAQRAMSGLGALGARTALPELAGGALQHAPFSSLSAAQQALGKPKKETKEQSQ